MKGFLREGLGWKVISRGFLIGLVTLIAFIIVYHRDPDNLQYAQTVAFATLVMAQLIHVFDCRSEKSVFSRNPFGNPYLVGLFYRLVLMLVVIYYPPLQPIFHTILIGKRLAVDYWTVFDSNFFTSRIIFIKKNKIKYDIIQKVIEFTLLPFGSS